MKRADQIGVGSFYIRVNNIAESLGVPNAINEIGDLTYDELKIFLVMGGEDADYYRFTHTQIGEKKFEKILQNLEYKGLITTWIVGDTRNSKTTDKGRRIHRAILEVIQLELIQEKIKK